MDMLTRTQTLFVDISAAACRVYKTSRNDAASEHPNLEAAGKKYKTSFYRMLGDVRPMLLHAFAFLCLAFHHGSFVAPLQAHCVCFLHVQIKQGKTGIF